jgi:hypothetical protein
MAAIQQFDVSFSSITSNNISSLINITFYSTIYYFYIRSIYIYLSISILFLSNCHEIVSFSQLLQLGRTGHGRAGHGRAGHEGILGPSWATLQNQQLKQIVIMIY